MAWPVHASLLAGAPGEAGDRRAAAHRSAAIAGDSRRVEPGDCFVAVPGFKQDARRFVPDAVRARRAARRDRGRAARRARRSPRCWCPRPACRSPGSPSAFYGHPSRRAHARRHHRHQRQDDDVLPGRGAPARARASPPGVIGTIQYVLGDETRAGQPDDAGGARAPGDARATCATTACAASRWRCRRTRSRSRASTGSRSTWRCSRTSPRTTSTSTARSTSYRRAKRRLFELLGRARQARVAPPS